MFPHLLFSVKDIFKNALKVNEKFKSCGARVTILSSENTIIICILFYFHPIIACF